MPTYEYACKSCGEHLEVVQSFRDDPLTTCPTCGGDLRKVFGSIGISFKGSGFYKTDSRSGSGTGRSRPSEKVEKAEKASESSGSSSGSSSKSGSDGGSSASSTGTDGTKAAASS